jgi:hypothetical protein
MRRERARVSFGRLIRVRKHRSDAQAVSYIVAIADPVEAIALIQGQVAAAGDEIEDMGRVSDSILVAMKLGTGQFMRA